MQTSNRTEEDKVVQLHDTHVNLRELEQWLAANKKFKVTDSTYEFEDYDGPVGDFIYACKLVPIQDLSNIIYINLYLSHLYLYIGDKYKLAVDDSPEKLITVTRKIILAILEHSIEETKYFIGTKEVYSSVKLPIELQSEVNHAGSSLSHGLAVFKFFAKKTQNKL